MKDYEIGIIGFGVVGKGVYNLFKEDVKAVYDPYVEKSATPGVAREKSDFKDLDLVVVCVMTKEREDGSCDTSIVEESLSWLHQMDFKGLVLIKSAVVPSKIKEFLKSFSGLRILVSPEYMGESRYFTPYWKYPDPVDMSSHTWQIFGGKKEDTSLCVDIFKRKMSVDTVFIQTDAMTASLCKYMENSFFATKVTFCNEWYNIASLYNIDYNELRECWLADPRINRNHTLVFPKDRGYGGKCFPKDVKAIIKDAKDMGYSADLMKSVDKTNEKIRNG